MRITCVRLLVLCLCAFSPSYFAEEPEWKVGLASGDITPALPIPMSGYASRVKPFEKVEQHLFVKALALEDQTGQKAVLITTDLIGLSKAVAEPIAQRIGERAGMKREQILLSWSHTHSGPALSLVANPGPLVPPEVANETVSYTRKLQDQLVELAVSAIADMKPAKLAWSAGVAEFPMNRREFTPRGVILGVNPRGPVDRSVPVLRITSAEDKLVAVLFAAACHNTTLGPSNMSVAGDYAGFAQARVQEQHPGVQAMFMLGCGGDANPYPRDTMDYARQHGESLGKEVCRVLEDAEKFKAVSGPLKVAFDYASLPLQAVTKEELGRISESGPSWQTGNARSMLASLEKGQPLPSHYSVPVAVWQFGQSLTLVALSGEVVVDYAHLVERALGPLDLWIMAYTNESFGYLPSARVIGEGGYENRGLSSGLGWFSPAAEDVLVAKVKELGGRVGRR